MDFIPLKANIYLFQYKSKEFMEATATLIEKRQVQTKAPRRIGSAGVPLSAETVPSLQHLLDVISSIIAEEYIMIAKENPEVFRKHGGAT